MAKRKNQGQINGAVGHSKKKKEESQENMEPIPVTILSGFLGSGKTTLLQHILTSSDHQLKIAVIVNDMAELNIDGQTVRRTKKEVVTLENGCICCTLRGDLVREIRSIKETGSFDYILIESTGIAEPQQVAESFCVDPETQALAGNDESMLWNAARLDTCVTVVDAMNFPSYLSSLKRFQEVFRDGLDDAEEDEGNKSIAELMIEQVEFANLILLNKIDLVDDTQLKKAKALIRSLNPKAKIVTASHGKINDLSQMLNSRAFSMEEAKESPGWLQSLQDGVDASAGEADEYGVSSFVYRARRPFHPLRLHRFLKQKLNFWLAEEWNSSSETVRAVPSSNGAESTFGSVLRSKGTCWIAGRDGDKMEWAQVGRIIQLSPVAAWLCESPPEQLESNENDDDDHKEEEDTEFGDRRQEIVLIGTKLQREAIESELDNCLLSEDEMKHHAVHHLPIGAYPDPLLPAMIHCDAPRNLFVIARPGQNQHFQIVPGFATTLQSLALNIIDYDADIRAVKVWLDTNDTLQRGLLIATLRPDINEQFALSIQLMPCDEGGEPMADRRIRLEVVTKGSKSLVNDDLEIINACEVHLVGKIEPLPYSEDGEEQASDVDIDDEVPTEASTVEMDGKHDG